MSNYSIKIEVDRTYLSVRNILGAASERARSLTPHVVLNELMIDGSPTERSNLRRIMKTEGEVEWGLVNMFAPVQANELEMTAAALQSLRKNFFHDGVLDSTFHLVLLTQHCMRQDGEGQAPKYGTVWLRQILEKSPEVMRQGSIAGGGFWLSYIEPGLFPRPENEIRLMRAWWDRMARMWDGAIDEPGSDPLFLSYPDKSTWAKKRLNDLGELWNASGQWTQWRAQPLDRLGRILSIAGMEDMTDETKAMLASVQRFELGKIGGIGEVMPRADILKM